MGHPEKPSDLDFYVKVATLAIQDAATLVDCDSSAVRRDIDYVVRRVKHEGIAFLTKTLPSLGKSLDKALASDTPLLIPPQFEPTDCGRIHPKFLSVFWKKCLNADGTVTGDDSPTAVEAVRAIRQICFLMYKLRGAHSPESEQEVIDSFVTVDSLLPDETEEVSLSHETLEAMDIARELIWRVLKGFDPLDIVPGHGPGAVATGEKLAGKMNFRRFYECLDKVYSYSEYFFYNYSHLVDELEVLEGFEKLSHGTAKVVLVPKDSRGPRLISMEPLEYQWIQQGIMKALVARLESNYLSTGYVNFTSQEINRGLALLSSRTGQFVTLDMKEASDRVSMWLVRQLFPANVYDALCAARTKETRLPDGRVITLKKFAPMGSAICFPVEALIFWALAAGSILRLRRSRWCWSGFKSQSDLPSVWVYGDDIILLKEHYELIAPVYNECRLMFNVDKCCTGSYFRESCGMDAYVGFDVTPTRIKVPWGDSSQPARLSWISYVNNLSSKGYLKTSSFLEEQVVQRFGEVPVTNVKSTYSWAFTKANWDAAMVQEYNSQRFKMRYNRRLQIDEIRLPVPTPRQIVAGAPGWSEILRLHRFWGLESQDGSVLSPGPCRYTVPRQLKARWRWVSAYALAY